MGARPSRCGVAAPDRGPAAGPPRARQMSANGCPRLGDQRCRVARVADRHEVEGGFGDRVHDGGRDLALEVAELAIEAVQHLCRVVVVEGVGTQCTAQPAHGDCRPEAMSLDIAHHETDLAVGQREDVVPVASQVSFGGQVAHRDVEPLDATEARPEADCAARPAPPGAHRPRSSRTDAGRSPPRRLPSACVSSGVKVRAVQPSHMQDPEQALVPKTGTPRSRWTPKSRRMGLRTESSLTSVKRTVRASRRPVRRSQTRRGRA